MGYVVSFWIHCNVSGEPTDTPQLVADDQGVVFVGDLHMKGRCSFSVPSNINGGFTVVWAGKKARSVFPPYNADGTRNPNYEGAELQPPLPPLAYAPAVPQMQRLHTQGEFFYGEDGQRRVLVLHTDFQLFQRYVNGEDIDAILDGRMGSGPRVFLTCDWLFKLNPGMYTMEHVVSFSRRLLKRGLYWEATVLADVQMYSVDKQQRLWASVVEALADEPNALVELANENQKNGVDADHFSAPGRRPNVSTGSYCDGWEPTGGWGDYVTFHPRRDHKWPYTVPMTVYEVRGYPGQAKPVLINEPIGAAEHDEPGRRSTDARQFQRMAASCRDFAAGAVFHSQDGLNSFPWGPVQAQCAEAFFKGLRGK